MDWITANAHHLLLALMLAIGIAVAVTCIVFIRHARDPLRPVRGHKEESDWLIGSAFVVVIVLGNAWLDNRDAQIAAKVTAVQQLVKAGYFAPEHARLDVDLNQCPPRTDGMTDIVLMAIVTQSDGKHIQRGCSRIAHRQFVKEQKNGRVRG